MSHEPNLHPVYTDAEHRFAEFLSDAAFDKALRETSNETE